MPRAVLLLLLLLTPCPGQEAAAPESPNLKLPADLPPDAAAAIKKGQELMEEARKKPADAVELAEKAIEQYKKAERVVGKSFALSAYYLGIAHQWTKEYPEARRRLERALDLNPSFHEAIVELGDVYRWQKKYPEAVKQYDKAIALKADYLLGHVMKAYVLCLSGDFAKSKEVCEKILVMEPKSGDANALLKICDREIKGPGFAVSYTKVTEHFNVVSNIDQKFSEWIANHVELIYAKYNKIFPKMAKSKEKFRVIVFNTLKEYMDYGSPPGTGGYYQPLTKKLVLWKQPKESDTVLVTYHEAFHQYLDYYISNSPQWFNEGHGDYFGPSTYNTTTKQMDIHTNSWRLPLIKRGIQDGKTFPFPKIMTMTQSELYDKESVGMNYAQSWSMVYFFWHYENGKYAKYLQTYFNALMDGEGLRGAYEAAFGKANIGVIESEWQNYIRELKEQ